MIDFVSIIPKLIGVTVVVNLIPFAYIYVLSQTELIKWDDKYNNIILMILNLLSGYIGIVVSTRMYDYRTESKFIKIAIPFTFFLEVLIIAIVLGWDYIPTLIQKVQ
jgi:uncharacterized membrane protein YsdA (DUF1294 family)